MDFDSCAAIETSQAILVTVQGDAAPPSVVPRIELNLSKFPGGRWTLQLDDTFAKRSTPAVILAHGVACLAVAWWAQLSPRSYLTAVRGAVFRSPLHIGFGQAPIAASASTGPTQRLPFASIVVSDVTPYVEQVLALADCWGSRFVDAAASSFNQPSNRSAGGTNAEAELLHHLDAFDPPAEPGAKPTRSQLLQLLSQPQD